MSASTPKPSQKLAGRRLRRHPRYHAQFPVTVSQLVGSSYRQLEGHCRDLSEAGIGVILAHDLKVGEVVGLIFSLPGAASRWEVRSVIRYHRGCHYGFEFLALPQDESAALKAYLKNLPLPN